MITLYINNNKTHATVDVNSYGNHTIEDFSDASYLAMTSLLNIVRKRNITCYIDAYKNIIHYSKKAIKQARKQQRTLKHIKHLSCKED